MIPPTSVEDAGMKLFRRATLILPVAVFAALLSAVTVSSAAASPFTDDNGTTHEPAIALIHDAGITNGCGAGRYCPNDPVTRGQMAAFLNRALDLPAATTPSGFTDTAGTFQNDIERLRAAGITNGCAPNRFCPNNPVTRGQMAAFLNRALNLPAATTPSGFTDTAGTFRNDIERLRAAGITTGCSSSQYCTNRAVTRGEMATFLVRALDLATTDGHQPPASGNSGNDVPDADAPAVDEPQGLGEGSVAVTAVADSSFDKFTSGGYWSQINNNYDSLRVYTPYWHSRLDDYDDAFAYRVAYGISTGSQKAVDHPDWLLRDASGDPAYIDFACSNGCIRYAADVGNASFRADTIAWATDLQTRGYRGLILDDVNFAWRFSNQSGGDVAPIDPRTRQPLTLANWQKYFAEFLEAIRVAVPNMEIMHNVIWYADTKAFDNVYIDRQIAAADYLQLERGANDAGLVRGTGNFGMQTFLSFIDRAHNLGTNVLLLDQVGDSESRQWYNLAAALLINDGNDMVSTQKHAYIAPNSFWAGFRTDLGDALGDRYQNQGVTRRDFTGGVVLFNDPGAPARTITLDGPMWNGAGDLVTSVTLGSREAAVLTAL